MAKNKKVKEVKNIFYAQLNDQATRVVEELTQRVVNTTAGGLGPSVQKTIALAILDAYMAGFGAASGGKTKNELR